MKRCLAAACLLASAVLHADARTPKAIVLVVVDQLRADLIDRYQQQWSKGLHRLVTDGAWFREAYYPYFNTVTCPGHASIATGAVPSQHGLVLNNWWDRDLRKLVTCTEDSHATIVSYGKPLTSMGESAARMQLTTLADEIRAQLSTSPHVIAFSLKPRSAIALGGHRPDAVAWFDDAGAWATSTAFSPGPVASVAEYIKAHPVEKDFGRTWDRALPLNRYLYESPAIGLQRTKGEMTPTFPHILKSPSGLPDQVFYDQWQSSPFADEYLASMALHVAEKIGYTTGGPHFVGIGFSTLDKVAHDYGPFSHEAQDILIRLDRTLGDLFAGLDRLVGPGAYTVALTADHGVAPTPERAIQQGIDAGRISVQELIARAEESMTKTLGAGTHVSQLAHDYLYLEPGVYEGLQANPTAMRTLVADLKTVPGVLRVITRDELAANHFDGDSAGRQSALSFFQGRSGDIMILFKPYWIESLNTTTHGSGYQYDTHVPVMFMGAGIAKGEYLMRVSPTDVAPTLAFLAGVTLPLTSGRVLSEAIAPIVPHQ